MPAPFEPLPPQGLPEFSVLAIALGFSISPAPGIFRKVTYGSEETICNIMQIQEHGDVIVITNQQQEVSEGGTITTRYLQSYNISKDIGYGPLVSAIELHKINPVTIALKEMGYELTPYGAVIKILPSGVRVMIYDVVDNYQWLIVPPPNLIAPAVATLQPKTKGLEHIRHIDRSITRFADRRTRWTREIPGMFEI